MGSRSPRDSIDGAILFHRRRDEEFCRRGKKIKHVDIVTRREGERMAIKSCRPGLCVRAKQAPSNMPTNTVAEKESSAGDEEIELIAPS